MTRATRSLSTALASTLIIYMGPEIASAAECENDWPNPNWCFPDILCPQFAEYWDLRRSVVHLFGPDIFGTGVLINHADCHTGDLNCGTPYLLTANHVISGTIGGDPTSGEINDVQTLTAFTFGFEAAVCGGEESGGAVALDGATVVAYDSKTDLLLLRLSTSLPPELGAFFAGWCGGSLSQAISISHPCGAPKRIAISEPGEIKLFTTMNRKVYDVYWWQEGVLAEGSSGAPLFEEQTGALVGIYTDAVQAGSLACSNPTNTPSQDRFTALSSILDFLPSAVDRELGCIGHFDSDEYAPIGGTVYESSYYGPGKTHQISATHAVWLVDGFHADFNANVSITIGP